MKLYCRLFVFAVVVVLLVTSTSWQRADADTTNINLVLNYNGGNCTQTTTSGGSGVIDLSQSQNTVTYQSQNAVTQFTVSFAANSCPYSSCPINSPSGSPAAAGQPITGSVGKTYTYSSVTFGTNQTCNNPQQLGVRVKP